MTKTGQKIIPCLWFNDQAEDAARFYATVFRNSKIGNVAHYGKSAALASGQSEGSVLTVEFELEGMSFLGLNGGPHFKMDPSISFIVGCESESEIDGLWAKLAKTSRIELGRYPFAEKYGWCEDHLGVNWQLILAPREQKISPALLFANEKLGKAEEAMRFYTSLFTNSKIDRIARDQTTGVILHATFTLSGQAFVAAEGPLDHEFDFSPAISFIVYCETQDEIDAYWKKLSAVPEAEQCGWLMDPYGVSWQIVPRILPELLTGPDPTRAERVMRIIIESKKINLDLIMQA